VLVTYDHREYFFIAFRKIKMPYIFKNLLIDGKASANLVSDAHLAALAIEYGCQLFSTDSDFSRFPKLRWRNPLK